MAPLENCVGSSDKDHKIHIYEKLRKTHIYMEKQKNIEFMEKKKREKFTFYGKNREK